MKRLSPEEINQIRQQANIVTVISNYIPLQQAGSNYKAICPFHDDHNPSMSINTSKQIYKCFVCGHGGNVFGFVRDYEQISFIEAVRKVGESVGFDFSDYQVDFREEKDDQTKRYHQLMNETQRYVEYLMANSKDDPLKDFLSKRHLNDEIISTFKIGYADSNYPVGQYLLKKGYKVEELETLQIAKQYENGLNEFFSHRVMFPITDEFNQIVAYTARALGDQSPKYINSATTPIYTKSKILYNYPMVKDPLLKKDPLLLCEGVMDVIAFYRAGYKKVVATLGTTLSDEQIVLIKKLNSSVILAFDGDDAGQNATYTMGKQLRNHLINVSVLNNPTDLDPDEILDQQGQKSLLDMVNKPKHWMEFILSFGTKRFGLNSYNARKRVLELGALELSQEDATDQSYFGNQLIEMTQFSQDILDQQLSVVKPQKAKPKVFPVRHETLSVLESEKTVLAHLLRGKKYAQEFKLNLGYLINPQANDLSLLMTNLYNSHDTISVADCLNMNLSQAQQDLLIEISEDPVHQYEKTSQKLKEAMKQVALVDIDLLLKQNQEKILNSVNPQEKLRLLSEKIALQQQKDKLISEV